MTTQSSRRVGLLLAALLLAGGACGDGAVSTADGGGRGPQPRIEPGPWQVVDEAALASIGDGPVYHQGPEPPRLLEHPPLLLPLPPSERTDGPRVLLVEAVISPTGRVAKARGLRAPALPAAAAALLDERWVATLRRYRLEPARLHDQAVAVYYNLSIELVAEDG